jgi:hypothetical protein
VSKFNVGDKARMPGVPIVVTIVAVDISCDEDGCKEPVVEFTYDGMGPSVDDLHEADLVRA